MAFQIAYAIQFIDKYSKVADDLLKKTKKIDERIIGTSKSFSKFDKAAVQAFRRTARSSKVAAKYIGNVADGTERLKGKIGSASIKVDEMTRSMRKQTLAGRMWGAVLGNIKFRIASLVVTMGAGAFGMSQLIDKAKSIEKAFTIMSALTGLIGTDFEFLEKKAFEFSRALGVPMEDVATGFKRVAGLKPELLKNVDALANLTKWTLILDAPMEQIEKVSRALTVALNVYGRTANDAAEFTNILAAAQRKGSAEVIDMALSFLKAGPVAETARIPFIRLISVIQGLARAGLLRQMAGTSFRTVMIRVAKQAKNQGDTFMGVLKRLQKELLTTEGGLGDISKASQIFGMRQAHAALAIMKSIPYIEEFEKNIGNTNIAVETAKKVLESYEKQVISIWALWDRERKDMFEQLKPDMLRLHEQWAMLVTQFAMAPGVTGMTKFFTRLLADIIEIGNALLLVWNIIASPFTLSAGWDAFMDHWGKIGDIWNTLFKESPFAFAPPPALEDIVKPKEIAWKAAQSGRIEVDVNLKGATQQVESVESRSEGDVDLNTGINFAF